MIAWVLAVGLAHAGPDDLRWRWEAPQTWLVSTQVRAESVFWVGAQRNTEARLVDLTVHLLTTCEAVDSWREDTRFTVHCSFDEVALLGQPFAGDAPGALASILQEWDGLLEDGAWMQLVMREDGRVVSMSLEGIDKDQPRLGVIHTVMHMWMSRAFAGFDLTLPDPDRATDQGWLDLHLSRAYHFPRVDGSFGAAETAHLTYGLPVDGVQRVLSRGAALVQRRVGAGEAQYVSQLDGVAHFDLERGLLLNRVYTVFSEPTSGHTGAQGRYFNAGQRLHMRWIAPDDLPPALPESGSRPSPGPL